MYDVVIIGGGPGGMTAALYCVRSNLKTLLIEKEILGGYMAYASVIENYPGFPDGIKGIELAQRIAEQVKRTDVEFKYATVKNVDFDSMKIDVGDEQIEAKTIILSLGLTHKKLGVEGEDTFQGRGVVYCTTCDGPLYRSKKTVVAGKGIPGITAALYLEEIAESVVLVTPTDELEAKEDIYLDKIFDSSVEVITNAEVNRLEGSEKLERVVIEYNGDGGSEQVLEADGIFVNIGKKPNTEFLAGTGIDLTKSGYIRVNDKQETSIKGVYAVGDVTNEKYKQVTTAVGDGCKAALNVARYLKRH
ncbi:MAG TPA: FAD-dependent oxidoreductase [Methanomicrobia archaeon]|nr:FAD-dependent oxidoreductase [Methanomicrobia archaeon]